MNKKAILITVGAVASAAAVGLGAYAVWNSKQLRAARAARRIGQFMYKAGAALQSISDVTA